MKNEYQKPEVEIILLSADDQLMTDDIIDGNTSVGGEFPF